MLPGSPSSKVRWSWPNSSATWLQSIGNMRRGGSEKATVSRWWVSAKPLARAQEEGNALPAPVVDEGAQGDEGLGIGVGGHALLLAVAGVLAADHVRRLERLHRFEDLLPLDHQRFGAERDRRLHRDEAEHLEEVGDDHVAKGAGFLVEAAPHLDRERLRHVDLDVVDVVAVPDRLEHAVGEAQRQQVLHRLAADVVVDAEDLLLLEDGVDERCRAPSPRRGRGRTASP